LLGDQEAFRIHRVVGHFQVRVIPGAGSGRGPVELHQNIVTSGVNKRAYALWLANAILSQLNKDPNIGLLAEVFNRLGGQHPRPQFDPQELIKILDEMQFRRGVSLAEALHVFPGECEEFHLALSFVAEEYSRAFHREQWFLAMFLTTTFPLLFPVLDLSRETK
jgi:hypothetical protein